MAGIYGFISGIISRIILYRGDNKIVTKFCRLCDIAFRYYLWIYSRYNAKFCSPGRVYKIPLGFKMWLPSWGSWTVAARRYGLWEPWTTKTLDSIVKPGMSVIELGACYGYFTLLLSKLTGPKGKVYSFEPCPKYFQILKRNVELNGVENVILYNKAVSDTVSKVSFDAEATHPYASLGQISGLDYSGYGNAYIQKKVEIECVSLSKFLKEKNIQMDILFMDIEGCEIKVIRDIKEL
ncbi:MAG TPA: hypothetical protein C5S37_12370, partial [Methanophagales archaeon]|nr:hypothetical protein [Methanophagales archaeon]HJH27523.1 hypothetical protein [Methanophagales archaeon]